MGCLWANLLAVGSWKAPRAHIQSTLCWSLRASEDRRVTNENANGAQDTPLALTLLASHLNMMGTSQHDVLTELYALPDDKADLVYFLNVFDTHWVVLISRDVRSSDRQYFAIDPALQHPRYSSQDTIWDVRAKRDLKTTLAYLPCLDRLIACYNHAPEL